MSKCIIKTVSARDYYGKKALNFYWKSMAKHFGNTIELLNSELEGKKYKKLVYKIDVKDIITFEKIISDPVFENWTFEKDYDIKEIEKEKIKEKIEKLKLEIEKFKDKLKLF